MIMEVKCVQTTTVEHCSPLTLSDSTGSSIESEQYTCVIQHYTRTGMLFNTSLYYTLGECMSFIIITVILFTLNLL